MPTPRFVALSLLLSAVAAIATAQSPKPTSPPAPNLQKAVPALSFQSLGTSQQQTPATTAAQPQIPLQSSVATPNFAPVLTVAKPSVLTTLQRAKIKIVMAHKNDTCYAIRSYNYTTADRMSPDVTTPTGSTTCVPSTQLQAKNATAQPIQSAKPR